MVGGTSCLLTDYYFWGPCRSHLLQVLTDYYFSGRIMMYHVPPPPPYSDRACVPVTSLKTGISADAGRNRASFVIRPAGFVSTTSWFLFKASWKPGFPPQFFLIRQAGWIPCFQIWNPCF